MECPAAEFSGGFRIDIALLDCENSTKDRRGNNCRLSLRERCSFRGAKGNNATVIDSPVLTQTRRHMSHDHAHGGHGHWHAPPSINAAFAIGVTLNLGFVIAEVFYGLAAHSLALLSDAGHNMSDVLGLLIAWGAIHVAKSLPTSAAPTVCGGLPSWPPSPTPSSCWSWSAALLGRPSDGVSSSGVAGQGHDRL